MVYTFIHPTKTGGTACELFFAKYYSEYIKGSGHINKCNNLNNPIIIIRNPIDRFISIYKYWKNGAIDTKYKRNIEFINKYKDITIKEFINLLKLKSTKDLYLDFTWKQHFDPQTEWITKGTEYKNVIIIKYEKNLNNKINTLINLLNIKNKNVDLPLINVSKDVDNIILDEEDISFIKEYFSNDYILSFLIDTKPELFRAVL